VCTCCETGNNGRWKDQTEFPEAKNAFGNSVWSSYSDKVFGVSSDLEFRDGLYFDLSKNSIYYLAGVWEFR
jgi:hypothetical protein